VLAEPVVGLFILSEARGGFPEGRSRNAKRREKCVQEREGMCKGPVCGRAEHSWYNHWKKAVWLEWRGGGRVGQGNNQMCL
jgi:hypothetical protein